MGCYDALVEQDKMQRQRDKDLRVLAYWVYVQSDAPAELHDLAARILGEPSLAHGAEQETDR